MNIFKLVNNPVATDEALYNLCNYIVYPKSNYDNRYVNSRGVSLANAYNEMENIQKCYIKYPERKAYHFILGFDANSGITTCEAMNIAFEISNLFYPKYQVLYCIHSENTNLHIHFAVNTISRVNGEELILDRKSLNALRMMVYNIINSYIC